LRAAKSSSSEPPNTGHANSPTLHLFKVDAKVSPALSLEEFPKLVATLGEVAKKYE
jgi:hypothetical protein